MKKFIFCACLLGISAAQAAPSFYVEPVQITTSDPVTLGGVLTLPAQKTQGIVLILQGSGNVGADGDVSGPMMGTGYRGGSTLLSKQIAERLALSGIASLRYAKRGFEDPSQLGNQVFPYLLEDARSALSVLRSRFGGESKLGIVGFSEGALVASAIATLEPVDALFLMGLTPRPIDDFLSYQFFAWPIELLQSRVDADRDDFLSAHEFSASGVSALPLAGVPWQAADADADGILSVAQELVPAYQGFFRQLLPLLETPAYKGWYQSLRALPPFSTVASAIHSPVYLYHGMQDPQTRWSWVVEDSRYFPVQPTIRLFEGLGHCFSPMDGMIGEVKTTGPISDDVLSALSADVSAALR